MTLHRQLLQQALDALLDIPFTDRNRAQLRAVAALREKFNAPEPQPAGWAVIDETGVIYIHRHREKAEEWIKHGLPGRRIDPVFLGD